MIEIASSHLRATPSLRSASSRPATDADGMGSLDSTVPSASTVTPAPHAAQNLSSAVTLTPHLGHALSPGFACIDLIYVGVTAESNPPAAIRLAHVRKQF